MYQAMTRTERHIEANRLGGFAVFELAEKLNGNWKPTIALMGSTHGIILLQGRVDIHRDHSVGPLLERYVSRQAVNHTPIRQLHTR